MEKDRKEIKEKDEREKKRKEKESKENTKKKAKFMKQVKPVMKRVIPPFLKGFGLKKDAVSYSHWYSLYGREWIIRVKRGGAICIDIGGGKSERPHLLMFGHIIESGYSLETKKIKMFIEDINEESIANVLIAIEKEIPKLK